MRALYTLTIFLSSALLFLIQPMVGKIILPAFGGSPAVWTTSMVFFQAALLAGYAYAHFSTTRLGARRQALIHIPLMALAVLTLPFATHAAGGAIGQRSPFLAVLWTLLSLVGAVFFVVSAGAPLLQRWFASTDDPAAQDPYFMYSASNLGSMVSLLAYPLLVEPRLRLSQQTQLWSYSYGLLIVCMGLAAWMLYRRGAEGDHLAPDADDSDAGVAPSPPAPSPFPVRSAHSPSAGSVISGEKGEGERNPHPLPPLPFPVRSAHSPSAGSVISGEKGEGERNPHPLPPLPFPVRSAHSPSAGSVISGEKGEGERNPHPLPPLPFPEKRERGSVLPRQKVMWVVLAAVPSSLLLGVTAYLTTNVAPVPLLWVVPLALYLLTFIFAFAQRPLLKATGLARFLPLVITPLSVAVILESSTPIVPLAVFHLTAFVVAAWMCHARLSESRPDRRHLTEFYLWISVGGVLGGFFNAAIAPIIFKTLLEYPLALVLACCLRPPRRPEDLAPRRWDGYYPLMVGLVTVALTVLVKNVPAIQPGPMRTVLAIGFPAALCFLAVDRPARYALSMAALFLAAFGLQTAADGTVIFTDRSFFGVHRVTRHGTFYELVHGTTTHGMQDRTRPSEPLTYYTRTGPIGEVFKAFHGPTAKKHVAFVGLGAGSVAAYGEPGQTMTFFEIDPVVKAIATNPKYFTYLRDSKANVDIRLGDARLTLAEQPNSYFGLIVLDAFSSDAIPVHLLTEEAFRLYLTKLSPHGIIAIHISNRYLDLEPVLAAMAQDLRLVAKYDLDEKTDDERALGEYASEWVIVGRDGADFGAINKTITYMPLDPEQKIRPWTDDFSNIFSVFKRNSD